MGKISSAKDVIGSTLNEAWFYISRLKRCPLLVARVSAALPKGYPTAIMPYHRDKYI
ncbi:hypothetical protein CHS0354_037865, partial [Potamilus streckersoni]